VKIQKLFHLVKDLPATGWEKGENEDWGIASCEVKDTSGDIVRRDGITWTTYHHPPERHLKILANHLRVLPDGSPPIIGRVEEFKKCILPVDGKSAKVLAFRFSWATDEHGVVTELAQKYRDLVRGGYLDSFSVGLMLTDFDQFDDGGLDIRGSELFEVSCVTIPALGQANVLRAIEDKLGDYLDRDAIKAMTPKKGDFKEALDAVLVRVDELSKALSVTIKEALEPNAHAGLVEGLLSKQLEPLSKSVADVTTLVKGQAERLEVLESALVVLTTSLAKERATATCGPDEDDLDLVGKKLDDLMRFVGK
jgi:hypothetical protein